MDGGNSARRRWSSFLHRFVQPLGAPGRGSVQREGYIVLSVKFCVHGEVVCIKSRYFSPVGVFGHPHESHANCIWGVFTAFLAEKVSVGICYSSTAVQTPKVTTRFWRDVDKLVAFCCLFRQYRHILHGTNIHGCPVPTLK